MKHLFSLFLFFAISLGHAQSIESPSGKIALNFKLAGNGQPTYSVNYKNKAVVLESALGIKLKGKTGFRCQF